MIHINMGAYIDPPSTEPAVTPQPTYDDFCAAQSRLDDDIDGYTAEQRGADEKLTDWYDRNVLGPADAERMRLADEAEFDRVWPEHRDGAVLEFEHGTVLFAARRQDFPELGAARWWVYGETDPLTWPDMVARFGEALRDATRLVDATAFGKILTGIDEECRQGAAAARAIGSGRICPVGAGLLGRIYALQEIGDQLADALGWAAPDWEFLFNESKEAPGA